MIHFSRTQCKQASLAVDLQIRDWSCEIIYLYISISMVSHLFFADFRIRIFWSDPDPVFFKALILIRSQGHDSINLFRQIWKFDNCSMKCLEKNIKGWFSWSVSLDPVFCVGWIREFSYLGSDPDPVNLNLDPKRCLFLQYFYCKAKEDEIY